MQNLAIISDPKAEKQLKAFNNFVRQQIESDIMADMPCFERLCKAYGKSLSQSEGRHSIMKVESEQFDILVHLDCEKSRIVVLNILCK